MTVMAKDAHAPARSWILLNDAYMRSQLRRLRLLLERRVRWLRTQWKRDPLQGHQGQVISDAQADWLLADGDRQAEARFYREDPEAVGIGRLIEAEDRELAAQLEALRRAGTAPALELLGHTFGLTRFERDALLLCLAPEVDASFERLYAYVQDDVTSRCPTPHLALALLVEPPSLSAGADHDEGLIAISNSFGAEATLRRFRLVRLEPGQWAPTVVAARPLRLDDRIADYLRGINRLDERVADLLRPIPHGLVSPSCTDVMDRLQGWIESAPEGLPLPALNLVGPPAAGTSAMAHALCDRLGLRLYGLDVSRLPAHGPERGEILRLLEREAMLLPLALYVDAADVDPRDPVTAVSIGDVIERLAVFLVVSSAQPWRTRRQTLAVRVTKPDVVAQTVLWQEALGDARDALDGHLEAIVQQFDLGPDAIGRAASALLARAQRHGGDGGSRLRVADLWQICREEVAGDLEGLAQRISPSYTWEDIVLPDDAFQQLRDLATQVAHRHRVYETWGFGAKLGRGRGINALFAGPSGTGKTMAAEVLAAHLRLDLYRVDLAGVVSKYIGETEKNLRQVFDAAEQSGAILFFDEADALFGRRTEVKDSHDRYANIEVNYLLQRMEDYRGLAILATNRKSALDQAFLRRLRFLVEFPFPDADHRRRIWRKVFPSCAAVAPLDYDLLARLEITGGNIRTITLNAAFLAASEGVSIGMAHLLRATRREYAKIEKMVTQAEFGPYYAQVTS